MRSRIFDGRPIDSIYIFDVHGHCGDSNVKKGECAGAEGVLKTMDALGVNQIILSSCESLYGDVCKGNEEITKVIESNPERFYGYATINPYYSQWDMLEKWMAHKNMLGIKIHAACHGTSIDDVRYAETYEYADKHELPVLFHAWSAPEVAAVARVVKKYRHIRAILAHTAFTDYSAKTATFTLMKECENVYVDTAMSITYDGALEWVVGQIGCDKVLYGSDMAFFDSRQVLGRVLLSKLSDYEKEKILGINAKELFLEEKMHEDMF